MFFLLERMLSHAPIGIALLDTELRYVRVNDYLASTNGRSPAAHIGRTLRDIVPPVIADLIEPDARAVLTSGSTIVNQELNYPPINAAGQPVTWLVSYYPVTGEPDLPQAIGVIMTDISDHKRVERDLEALVRQKEALLLELHHRVKNNLQVISSLLDLQMMTIVDEHARAAFVECQRRVYSMALVHQLLYASEGMAHIHAPTYVDTLLQSLRQSYTGSAPLHLSASIADIQLDADTAIPCALIINELVMNAFKHAFPHDRGGTVLVTCALTGDAQVELSVRDNGIGLPDEHPLTRPKGLGLRLVVLLAQQLNGTLTLTSDEGTIVSIVFTPRFAAVKG
jgi:PAS domain S-box-containing protein